MCTTWLSWVTISYVDPIRPDPHYRKLIIPDPHGGRESGFRRQKMIFKKLAKKCRKLKLKINSIKSHWKPQKSSHVFKKILPGRIFFKDPHLNPENGWYGSRIRITHTNVCGSKLLVTMQGIVDTDISTPGTALFSWDRTHLAWCRGWGWWCGRSGTGWWSGWPWPWCPWRPPQCRGSWPACPRGRSSNPWWRCRSRCSAGSHGCPPRARPQTSDGLSREREKKNTSKL